MLQTLCISTKQSIIKNRHARKTERRGINKINLSMFIYIAKYLKVNKHAFLVDLKL